MPKLRTDVSQILNNFRSIDTTIQQQSSDITTAIEQQIDLNNILGKINAFWTEASTKSDKTINELSTAVKKMDESLATYLPYIRASLYVLGGVLVFSIVLATVAIAFLLYRAFTNYLFFGDFIGNLNFLNK